MGDRVEEIKKRYSYAVDGCSCDEHPCFGHEEDVAFLLSRLALAEAVVMKALQLRDNVSLSCGAHDGWCETDGTACVEMQAIGEFKQALTAYATARRGA